MSARGPRYTARQRGEPFYETDKPCKQGHVAMRVTSTGTCTECKRAADRKKYETDPKSAIAKKQAFYRNNAESIRLKRREKYAANPDKERAVARERSAIWRKLNPDKVKAQKAIKDAYKKANPHKSAALLAKRRAAKKHRTPSWLTLDQLWMIEQAYELAALRSKATGFAWHVDHICPLQGKDVSGLHVPWNLQVIPWRDNLSKSNKTPADVVAALGNGSTKAGSDKLYDMMHSIRVHARSSGPKDLPPPAKSPLAYLKGTKQKSARG